MATYKTSKVEEKMAEKWFTKHKKVCRYAELGRKIAIADGRVLTVTRTYGFSPVEGGEVKEVFCACGESKSITDRL